MFLRVYLKPILFKEGKGIIILFLKGCKKNNIVCIFTKSLMHIERYRFRELRLTGGDFDLARDEDRRLLESESEAWKKYSQ